MRREFFNQINLKSTHFIPMISKITVSLCPFSTLLTLFNQFVNRLNIFDTANSLALASQKWIF